jgi:hypothetical protein
MAKTYLTNINLKGNQLLNAAIQPSASAPSALTAGQLYYNTTEGIFYYSTGAGTGSWEPVGVQYITAVGDNLSVNNGQLTISTNPSFDKVLTTNNGHGTNLKIGDDAWLGDVNLSNTINVMGVEDQDAGYISFGQNGSIIDNNQLGPKNYIGSNSTDLVLGSSNDIILHPQSNYAYIGDPQVNGSNRIATLADIAGGAIQTVNGTTDQINVDRNGEVVTISLPSYINIPDGEMHLRKTEYWNNGNQYGVIDGNSYNGHFNIVATGRDLELEANNGGSILLNSNNNSTIITNGYFNSSANTNYFCK